MCAGAAAGATKWGVDDSGGAGCMGVQAAVDSTSERAMVEIRAMA